jgi:hypothetical protein
MMKPGMGAYDRFKQLFDRFSREAGKEQYLIPYFIAAHPGTTDEDMLNLALWLKKNNFRAGSGADLPADADGAGHRPCTTPNATRCASCRVTASRSGPCAMDEAAATAQGLSCVITIPTTGRLLREALKAHGPRRSDRQRQEATDSCLAARRYLWRRGWCIRSRSTAKNRANPEATGGSTDGAAPAAPSD